MLGASGDATTPAPTDAHANRTPTVDVAGEVDGIDEIAATLGLAAAPPPVALAEAWRRWSTDLVRHVGGAFALAVRHGAAVSVYRAPAGLQSAYWRGSEGSFDVAWRTSTLMASEGARDVHRPALHEYLRFLDIAAPRTWYRDVHAVEPGAWLHLLDTGAHTEHASSLSETAHGDLPKALSSLDELLRAGVQRCLAGATAPAAFLSGGVDSALLCAIARRKRPDVTAVTVGFDGTRYDETPVAGRIAAHLGIPHRILRFDRGDFLDAFDRLARHMDQPMADPATPATVLAFDDCRKHFDVVLDGTGADEAVGALPPRHVRLAVDASRVLPGLLRRALGRALRALPGLEGYAPVFDFEHPADTMIRWRGFTRPEIEELCGEPVSFADTRFYRVFDRQRKSSHFVRYSALLDAMPCDRLVQATQVSGAPVRYPYCDHRVDGFLRGLPIEWRWQPDQPKRILRELLARYAPRSVWDLPKHGFDFPLRDFLVGDDFMLVRRHLLRGAWLDLGLLRPDIVRRYARRFIDGDAGLEFRVWALVVLGAWLEHHPTSPPP